jgi:putative membrane protein
MVIIPKFMRRDRPHRWTPILFSWQGSVLPAILPRVAACTLFAIAVTWIDLNIIQFSIPLPDSLVPSIVLGLLLVFRTNTAYERFWEGRKAWGTLVNTVRNLARGIWVAIAEEEVEDRYAKVAALKLLTAFAIALKLHLRSEPINEELSSFLSKEQYQKLKTMNNPPIEIAFWMSNYLQSQQEKQRVNAYQLVAMFKLLDRMVDVLGSCERILKTPIPLAYAIHLRQLIFLYCFATPFQMVDNFGWSTPVVVAIVAFTVFGIEAIGVEIENPFGHDANDLPLDQICRTMQLNIEDLISLAPCVQRWHNAQNQPQVFK